MRAIRGQLWVIVVVAAIGCASPVGVGPPYEADLGGASDDVKELLNRLLAEANENPDDAGKRAALGMGYEVNGLPKAALTCYEQAAAMEPTEPRWSYALALARAALGDLEGGLTALDDVFTLREDYVPAHLYRGQWLLDLARVEQADAAFRRAAELAPEDPAGWIGRARVHLKREESAEASRILENLIRKYRHPYIYQLLGMAYRQQGDLGRAQQAFAQGKPVARPGWPDPWNNEKAAYRAGFGAELLKAEELMDRGQVPQALEILESIRQERPNDLTLLNNLSVAYRRTNQEAKAFAVLQSGLESHPNYFPFHLNIASAYQRRGDLDRALYHIDRAIELNPTLAHAHIQKGGYLTQMRRLPEALEEFNAALTYDAANPRVFLSAGLIEAELKNWPRAVERLEQALRLDPSLVMAHIGLATVHAERGEFEAATRAVERAAALAPNHPRLDRVKKLLERRQSESR